jgi:hypothetical protein
MSLRGNILVLRFSTIICNIKDHGNLGMMINKQIFTCENIAGFEIT